MVFLPTHHRHPKPWAAYATAAIVLHGLAIALLLNGTASGPQGDPMEVELVEMVDAPADAFTAPPQDNLPASDESGLVDPGLELPLEPDRSLVSEPTSPDPVIADSVQPAPPSPEQPLPASTTPDQPNSDQPNPDQLNPVPTPPAPTTPAQPAPAQPAPAPPNPIPTTPAQPAPVQTAPANSAPNPADIPQGQVAVPNQSKGIGLNVGLTIAAYGNSDIPLIRRATPKGNSQQFVLDPSQFACTSFVTPEASRDLGQPVTLDLAIDAQGQVTDLKARATDSLSPTYLDLAQCIAKQWAFDPAIDQTEQGEQRARPDNATVTLTLQSQSL